MRSNPVVADTAIITLRRWFVRLVVLCVLTSSVGGNVLALPSAPSPHRGSSAKSAPSDDLILEWHTPDAQIVPRADPQGAFGTREVSVVLPGYLQTDQPGEPQLPFTSTLIALPSDAAPTLRVLSAQEIEIPLPPGSRLMVAPSPEGVQRDAEGHPIGVTFSPVPARPFGSKEPVVLEPAGVVRGVRLARLIFYPVRPAGGHPEARSAPLRVTTHLRVAVAFNSPFPGAPTLPDRQATDPLLDSLRSVVINPEQVRNSQYPIPNTQQRSATGNPEIAIEVITPGLTAITYEALAMAGFPVASADPHMLHVTRAGSEIAVEWDGDDDTSFEPGERLLFYADPRPSRWTNADVYFLSEDTTPGLRVSSRSAAPTGQPGGVAWANATAEVNALYTPDCFCGKIPAGRDGDHWTWDDLSRPGHPTGAYPIQLPPAVDATKPATLTLWLIGYTDPSASPDHRVDVKLNDTSLGRVEWNGKQVITATLSIAAGVLHSNVNTVTLTLPGLPGIDVEGMWLDAFSITYARSQAAVGASVRFATTSPLGQGHDYTVTLASSGPYRVYDVTDPIHPQKLADVQVNGNVITLGDAEGGSRRYLAAAPDGILSPARIRAFEDPWAFHSGSVFTGTDVLLITHPAFVTETHRLASLHQSQGLSTQVINVLGLHDAWGDGRLDPAAIRNFIANAYATWDPRPALVVLVGDGSFDPKGYRAGSPITFIPPYLDYVDLWGGEAAADNRYVAVDGNDNLPDLLIGRLPVQTLTDTQSIVDKIVRYETLPLPGGWNKNVDFVADNPDQGIDFAAQPEFIATHYVTSPFTAQRIYYKPPATTSAATRQAVMSAWDAGALIMQYNGHSSWQQWAEERFFHLDDLPTLRNDRRWPIVLEMTCYTGGFQRPEPTLDEELVKLSDGGAVAAWGGTTLGQTAGHDQLNTGFFQAVFSDTVGTVGQATLAGKLTLAATGQNLDLLDTFVLLGDPALRINRAIVPWPYQVYLPIVSRK